MLYPCELCMLIRALRGMERYSDLRISSCIVSASPLAAAYSRENGTTF